MAPASRTASLVSSAMVALLAFWAYRALILPPPPKLCGTPGGPPVTSPRIRLHDGRHLAYKESGVPRSEARHRVVIIHGLVDSKEFSLSPSLELVEKLKIYFVCFDRAGFGESDPHPTRSVKSTAMDIMELADQLGLGERFYVVGASIGGYAAWGCIKHIPHRLAGVALIVPGINYWWPSLPTALSKAAFQKLQPSDQRAFWVAHHAPWLLYAYMTQKLVAASANFEGHPDTSSRQDREILEMLGCNKSATMEQVGQQGLHESFYRDLIVAFGDWGFDPAELPNPLIPRGDERSGNYSVHLWQGGEDRVLDPEVQRYLARKLPWVQYHECSDCGHLFLHKQAWSNAILRALILGTDQEEGGRREPSPSFAAA